ncbi:interleukin-12 subunit alpha [Conger conger]|uniref:interleukin-12 subunit alpha n=1 Tax=Conger conger TaxID=82655 RepID=UPI002A5AE433|nr:interleukin-12 subunit alpha [Conger conger]
MQAKVPSGLLSWLLLAALSPLLCHLTAGSPLKTPQKLDTNECIRFSRVLLTTVSKVLTHDKLYRGFNCSQQLTEINSTLSACEPDAGQEECLGNIKQDLEQRRDSLQSYDRAKLELMPVVTAIQDLLQTPSSPRARNDDFDTRVALCTELKGFHVRTITINRIMGYLAV